MADNSEGTTDAVEAEKVRAAGEARRQKILDASSDRMDRVNGLSEGGGGGGSKAARLAAMRRRRFKKKPAATKEPPATDSPVAGEGGDGTTTTAEATKEVPVSAAAVKEKEVIEEVNTPGVQQEKQQQEPAQRKYQGVAKMRRKMLEERKRNEQQQQQQSPGTTASTKTSVATSHKSAAERVTILFHGLVVLFLFTAGLDVGWRHSGETLDSVRVLRDYGAREGRILQVLPASLTNSFSSSSRSSTSMDEDTADESEPVVQAVVEIEKLKEELDGEQAAASGDEVKKDGDATVTTDTESDVEVDEFADEPVKESKTHGIDPLFGVDLDEITRGDSFIMMIARAAVTGHRMILAVVYYLPRDIFRSLLVVPPLLGLIAIFLRQAVGHTLLGASLPPTQEEAPQNDLISTATGFAKNFFKANFPTLVSLYSGWQQLRSDMYVVMCGLFVGMAISHSLKGGTPGDIREEL